MDPIIDEREHSVFAPPHWWQRVWQVLPKCQKRKPPRRLQLCESLSLGGKRMVAVIQYDTCRFLIGGTAHTINLLARLGESPDFSELLSQWCERQR